MCGAGLAGRAGDDEDAAEVALVRVGTARRDQLAHRRTGQQLEVGAVDPFENFVRDADVGDDDVAGAQFRRRQNQWNLRR